VIAALLQCTVLAAFPSLVARVSGNPGSLSRVGVLWVAIAGTPGIWLTRAIPAESANWVVPVVVGVVNVVCWSAAIYYLMRRLYSTQRVRT
jgi:hypothetical protein